MAKLGIKNTVTVGALKKSVGGGNFEKSLHSNLQKVFIDLANAVEANMDLRPLLKGKDDVKISFKVVIEREDI